MLIFQRMYEGIMLLLVMLTIMTLWTDNSYNPTINWIVWFIFVVDFMFRFFKSKEKLVFLKQNPFLVVALIPFDQFFQVARIVRVIYLFRIKTITKYYIQPLVNKITYQSKLFIILMFLVVLACEAVFIWYIEEGVTSIWMSIQYVFYQILFFGKNKYEAEHSTTILCFTLTSMIGLILQGIALQWLFTKLEELYRTKYKRQQM